MENEWRYNLRYVHFIEGSSRSQLEDKINEWVVFGSTKYTATIIDYVDVTFNSGQHIAMILYHLASHLDVNIEDTVDGNK